MRFGLVGKVAVTVGLHYSIGGKLDAAENGFEFSNFGCRKKHPMALDPVFPDPGTAPAAFPGGE
jgi:hypothetical protein